MHILHTIFKISCWLPCLELMKPYVIFCQRTYDLNPRQLLERHCLPSLYAIFFCKELCLFHQFLSIGSRSQPFILALKSSTESIEKVNTFWYFHLQGNPSQSKLLLRYFMQCMQKRVKRGRKYSGIPPAFLEREH